MKSKGFTLIELMIVVAIIGIAAAIAWPVLQGTREAGTTCRGGYLFAHDHSRRLTQILDNQGHGIPCQ